VATGPPRSPLGLGVRREALATTAGIDNVVSAYDVTFSAPKSLSVLWALTQDERRAIFEEKSKHNAIGLKYLPGVARRLHHCRDLSEAEPFDFLTLFDYAKDVAGAFDDLVAALRATEEWKYVEREVDIRLVWTS